MAKEKRGWTRCPICDVKLKAEKLEGHLKRVHPKGAETDEERKRIRKRRNLASKSMKWVVVGVIIVVLIFLVYTLTSGFDGRGSEVGDKPYNFSLEDQDGQTYVLDDHLGEQPVLFAFLSTTCPHCENMAWSMQEIFDRHSEDASIIIIISNRDATSLDVKTWAQENNLDLPVLHDKGGDVFHRYGLKFFPTGYLVDGDGEIHWKEAGAKDTNDLEEKLQEVL